MRNIVCTDRTAEKLNILAGAAGIAFYPRKMRAETRAITGIDELYCHMSIFAEAEESAFGTKERYDKE